MIKGCEKKIIFIQGGESSPFENAYFVLRKDSEKCCNGGDDILREANRIINERIPSGKIKSSRKKRKLKSIVLSVASLAVGMLCGSLLSFLIRVLA